MKKIHKIIYVLFIGVLCLNTTISQTSFNAQNLIYSVRPNDQRFLRYIYLQNNMNTSFTNYRLGEFTLVKSNGAKERIHLNNTLKLRVDTIRCTDSVGTAYSVYPYTRTVPFIVPNNGGTINFYRTIGLMIPCGMGEGSGWNSDDDVNADNGRWWAKFINSVPDEVEFVIEVYDKRTNQKVGIIDSVGIPQNTNSKYAVGYGTDPNGYYHTRTIPNNLYGDTVYLQLSPRRWGSTPLGMPVMMENYVCNLSGLPHHEQFWAMPGAMEDSIYVEQYRQIHHYCDSLITATGQFPSGIPGDVLFHLAPRRLAHLNHTYHNKYFDTSRTVTGHLVYRLKSFASPKISNNDFHEFNWLKIENKKHQLTIEKIYPLPAFNTTVYITIKTPMATGIVTAELYTLGGKSVQQLWQGKLPAGESIVQVPIQEIFAGHYMICFKNGLEEIIGVGKIVIGEK